VNRWLAIVPFALSFSAPGLAHEPAVIVLGPSPDWCTELRAAAEPADVVHLLPGRYEGGCELDRGGLVELNEALLVSSYTDEPAIIEADESGVSLFVTGEPTRVLGLVLEGRVEVRANNVTIDGCDAEGVVLEPGFDRFALVWSTVATGVAVDVGDTVIRGTSMPSLSVQATTGLVAENAIDGDASSTVPFHRNLVMGDLDAAGDAFANVVRGEAVVAGALYGNTLLGPVTASDARNNLTLDAVLPEDAGNLVCPHCMLDPMALDVRPTGQALVHPRVDAPGDVRGFCLQQPHTLVGAVDVVEHLEGLDWSAFDRVREGCIEGGTYEAPPPPPPDLPELEPIREPETDVTPRSGCATAPATPALLGSVLVALFVRRRRELSADRAT
jgi:hypothetical protein